MIPAIVVALTSIMLVADVHSARDVEEIARMWKVHVWCCAWLLIDLATWPIFVRWFES